MVTPETSAAPTISFPGKDPSEEFRFYFHQHKIRMVKATFHMLLWLAAFAAGAWFSGVASLEDDATRRIMIVVLAVFFAVPQLSFLLRLYRHFLYLAIVTDKKVHIFKRTLVSVDRHESVDLSALQDIKKQQRGIVQNMLGFGTLTLEAQNSKLILHFTPHIDKVYDSILALRERARHIQMPEHLPSPLS